MSDSSAVTVALNPKVRKALSALARKTRQRESTLAAKAIASYVELNRWQIEQIEKAVRSADAGRFASDDEVESVFRRLTAT